MTFCPMAISGGDKPELAMAIGIDLAARSGQEHDPSRTTVIRVFDESREALLRYLACLGLDADEAEDTIQETFLRLYMHLRDGGRAGNLRGWSFRVAHNLAMNLHKARPAAEAVIEQTDPGLNPEQMLLRKERWERLRAAVDTLSPQQRHCLFLRTEGFCYREIGDILGVSVSTVAEMLRRGIQRLSGSCNA